MTSRKKPHPDLVIRLAGSKIRPWDIPMGKLSDALRAVQALAREGAPTTALALRPENETPADEDDLLYLLDVRSGSATYKLASSDAHRVMVALQRAGRAIENPEQADWSSGMLGPIETLSQLARSMDCVIELRRPPHKREHGEVIATIGPQTGHALAQHAYVRGETSVHGKIERVGGASETRCGIRLDGGSPMIYCSVASADLAREMGRYLYKHVTITGVATWFRRDWTIKTIDVTSIEPPKEGSILATLRRVREHGGSAWDDVDDPEKLIRELRG